MERNVDLTLDRKFSNPLTNFRNFLKSKQIPWKVYIEPRYGTRSLVLTGNSTEILNKRREIEFYENKICECCGESFNNKTWDFGKYALCKKCEEELEITCSNKKSYWLQRLKDKL